MKLTCKTFVNGELFETYEAEGETKSEAWAFASSWIARMWSKTHAAHEVSGLTFEIKDTTGQPSQIQIDSWMEF